MPNTSWTARPYFDWRPTVFFLRENNLKEARDAFFQDYHFVIHSGSLRFPRQ